MTTEALSVAFRADSITTASKATLQRMAKTLGFTQNQTVLYALARLRDELQASQPAAPTLPTHNGPIPSYPPLTTAQHQILRQHAPKRRAKPVRSSSITDLLRCPLTPCGTHHPGRSILFSAGFPKTNLPHPGPRIALL